MVVINLASRLEEMIRLVDTAAFPGQPLKVVVVDTLPGSGEPQFGLGYIPEHPDQSFYFIFKKGLEQYFAAGKDFSIHTMLEMEALARAFESKAVYQTEEEILLAASIHEVRHRVQFTCKVPLFDGKITSQVLRCQYWTEVQARHYQSDSKGAYEFDAKFFEQYGAQELRQKRLLLNAEDLGKLLHMTAEQFLEREHKM